MNTLRLYPKLPSDELVKLYAVTTAMINVPISTVNITGFLIITKGLSLMKDCLMATLTNAEFNNFDAVFSMLFNHSKVFCNWT